MPQPHRADLWRRFQNDADAFYAVNTTVGEDAPTIRWFGERDAYGRLLLNIINEINLAKLDHSQKPKQKGFGQ